MTTSPNRQCSACGATVPEDAPEGLCPVCLLGGLASPVARAQSPHESQETSAAPANLQEPIVGMRIGHYKLLQEIGEGGFGIVYMAEQEQPVRRRVALKIIKLGMDTRQVIARFEAERQALAILDHPGIAKVHDGGATETGR